MVRPTHLNGETGESSRFGGRVNETDGILANLTKAGILFAMRKTPRLPARYVLTFALCGIFSVMPAAALSASGTPPKFQADSAIMIEAQTGTVLYADHADLPYPPASLTKMMTLHIALDQVEQGKLSLNQEIVPVKQAWATSMPPRSSLMFLGPNQRLTLKTLLTGLIVDSGNDAAYELAYLIAGSVPAFAKMMNQQAARLGLPHMHFVEPSGLSSKNRITAREYAEFCRIFIRLHPNSLKDIFAVKKFSYPEPKNLTNGNTQKPIVQYNRNLLLWSYPGTDGFKTGYIDQSGYNMAITTKRNGMRLIAVVLGVRGTPSINGEQLRAKDEEELLSYGFSNFVKLEPQFKSPQPVHVWKGSARSVVVVPDHTPAVVLPKAEKDKLKVKVEQTENVLAPVYTGDTLGKLVFTVGGKEVSSVPLVAQDTVSQGGVIRRGFDSVVLFFRGIFGLPGATKPGAPPPLPVGAPGT